MDRFCTIRTWPHVLVVLLGVAGCATDSEGEGGGASPPEAVSKGGEEAPAKVATTVSFEKDIKPILKNKCTICHNKKTLPARPNFETAELALGGTAIVPGQPDKSRMLQVVTESREESELAMPPVSHELSEREISLLRTWISEGASWPPGEKGRVVPAFIPEE